MPGQPGRRRLPRPLVDASETRTGRALYSVRLSLQRAMRLAVTAAQAADGLYRARPIGARRLPDIFGYDILEALRRSGCSLCRVEAIDDRRWMDSFWREGKQDPGTRRRFYAAGGFCRHHAWLLHRLVAAEAAGAAIADVYGSLAERDIAWLDELRASREAATASAAPARRALSCLRRVRRRRRAQSPLLRRAARGG